MPETPRWFRTASACRRWLERHHGTAAEAWFGFYRKDSGRGGITYPEALDQALCFGWIDGIRKRHDAESFKVRFTPRRPRSKWSRVNTARMKTLLARGDVTPAGKAAFDARIEAHSVTYSFESAPREFSPALLARLRANKRAFAFHASQPPGYRRQAQHYVMSAKQEVTRRRRMETLIARSAAGLRLEQLTWTPEKYAKKK